MSIKFVLYSLPSWERIEFLWTVDSPHTTVGCRWAALSQITQSPHGKGCEPTRIAFLFSNKELVVILDFMLLPNYYNLLFIFILLLHSICLNGICKEMVLKVKLFWKLKVGDKNPSKWMTKFLISLIQRKVSVTEKGIKEFE